MERIKILNRISRLEWALLAVLIATMWVSTPASAQTLHTLVNFTGVDGEAPGRGPEDLGGLVADAHGNLFGTTHGGGAFNAGTVFEIKVDSTTPTGYATTPTTLVTFNNTDGAFPAAGLTFDARGNLFGTTDLGRAFNLGTVFEIKVDNTTTTGYATTPTTLVTFDGSNGGYPLGGLIFDAHGTLFGTTLSVGPADYGTVFEIKVDSTTVTGYASAPTTLVRFTGSDGADPVGRLIFDAQGNLFGTTFHGGTFACSGANCGTVFEIKLDNNTATGYATSPTTLVNFDGLNGADPNGGLIFDEHGNLFGTTVGGPNGFGTVFEIKSDNTTATGYATAPTTLVNFNNTDGAYPYSGVILDAQGNLFGTTEQGGAFGYYGTVFEIKVENTSPTGYATTPTTLVNFDGSNGGFLFADLIADAHGNLFGAAEFGGTTGNGTVFELTDSGFVPPAPYAGTPGTPNCVGVSTSSLAQNYGGLAHAATSLGFTSVKALQKSIATYCTR